MAWMQRVCTVLQQKNKAKKSKNCLESWRHTEFTLISLSCWDCQHIWRCQTEIETSGRATVTQRSLHPYNIIYIPQHKALIALITVLLWNPHPDVHVNVTCHRPSSSTPPEDQAPPTPWYLHSPMTQGPRQEDGCCDTQKTLLRNCKSNQKSASKSPQTKYDSVSMGI